MNTQQQQKNSKKTQKSSTLLQQSLPLFFPDPKRTIEYFGVVNYATTERVTEEIRTLFLEEPTEDIYLTITCAGGPTGTAMSFFDHMQYVMKPRLITIGSGDVDSSGMLIFLSGGTRYLTKNTTLLLHKAGRRFDQNQRYTASEMEAMWREDNLKDYQYASVVADRSEGRLTANQVLELMERNIILTPIEMVSFGLADFILE